MPQPVQTTVTLTVKWLIPSDPYRMGREAIELVTSIQRIPPFQKKLMTQPVLDGFEENFRTQSAAGQPWYQLAERTRRERLELMHDPAMSGRLVPGFNPWQPILQRTGDYKSSWVDRGHPDHVEYWHGGQLGAAPQASANLINVEIGSDHPYMYNLSKGIAGAGEPGPGGFEMEGLTGWMPSRRVDIIEDSFSEMIERRITLYLSEEAKRVPAQGP